METGEQFTPKWEFGTLAQGENKKNLEEKSGEKSINLRVHT